MDNMVNSFNLCYDIVNRRYILINFNLEKLLSTDTTVVNNLVSNTSIGKQPFFFFSSNVEKCFKRSLLYNLPHGLRGKNIT